MTRKCCLCGKEFTVIHPRQKVCSDQHYRKCEICGKDMPIKRPSDPKRVCSHECEMEMRRRHNVEKYGVDHPMHLEPVQEKHRKTMQETYGVDSPLQSEEIKSRAIQSNRDRFGSDWALGNSDIRESARSTMQERYGAEYTLQSDVLKKKVSDTISSRYGVDCTAHIPGVQAKIEQTCISRYGARNPMLCRAIIAKSRNSRIKKNGRFWTSAMYDRYSSSSTNVWMSDANMEFGDLLESRKVRFEYEKPIGSKSFDIYVPDQKTVVEIDPSYTHSHLPNHYTNSPVDKTYHRDHTYLAEENGYRCIHIFDWDDPEIIADMLMQHTVVYARFCRIERISSSAASEFEDRNHLQGRCAGQDICYGLFFGDDLISVMTFGKPRYNPAYSYELLRLCTLRGYAVVGGAERMFKHFIEDYHPKTIISYCDRSKFSGEVYTRLGFKHIRDNYPNIVWSKGRAKITNNMLLAHGYDRLFGTSYGKGTDNKELMIQNGWRPVYDCGQGVYVYES